MITLYWFISCSVAVMAVLYEEKPANSINYDEIILEESGVPSRISCLNRCHLKDVKSIVVYDGDLCQCMKKKRDGKNEKTIELKQGSVFQRKDDEGTTDKGPLNVFSVTLGYYHYGDWLHYTVCPRSSRVIGFRLRLEQPRGGHIDDTALNGLQLACSDGSKSNMVSGHYGSWTKWQMCSNSTDLSIFIKEFAFRTENTVNNDDNTAGNNIRMKCSNSRVLDPTFIGAWGDYKNGECLENTYLCGIQVQMDGREKADGRDVSGINQLKFICCI